MLIYIDNTIADYLDEKDFNIQQMDFFARIASAFYQGKCVVFGDLRSLDALFTRLGDPVKSIYKIIRSRNTQSGSIANYVVEAFIISRSSNPSNLSKLPTILKGKEKYLSLDEAAGFNWNFGSCLLGENISDCEFYENIGKHYCRKNKIRGVQISFHCEHGGGSDTASVLKKCVSIEAIPTLCLSDADIKYGYTKKHGKPSKGGTFIGINKIAKLLGRRGLSKRFCFYCIPVHEIENLIPLSLLKCFGSDICPPEGIANLEALTKIQNGLPILFYDFKKGEVIDRETPHGYYWYEIFSQAGILNKDGEYCRIGCESLLEHANSYISENNICSVIVDTYLEIIWDEIGQLLFTWGCATTEVRG